MTTSRLFTYLMLFMVGGLLSCSDHPIQPLVTPGSAANRLRVKTLTLDLPNNQAKVSSFRYDGQGRLSQILTYQTPDSAVSTIEYNNYTYDGQNRLTGLRREVVLYPRGSGPNSIDQYTYIYNAAGQVSGLNRSNSFSLTFTYNGANQLVSSSRFYGIAGLSVTGFNSFTFTGNNLTSVSDRRNIPLRSGSDPNATRVDIYTHDDKINPFYGVYLIPAPYPIGNAGAADMVRTYFGGIDNFLNLSRNNVLTQQSTITTDYFFPTPSSTSYTESSVYQYQYNVANLPIVRTKTSTTSLNNTVAVETLHFEYESY
ncbi:MAG: hypothetical protein JWP57_319 [Spirosoma sp.]|nr:hypothetical protein [Spirosoma sp.]